MAEREVHMCYFCRMSPPNQTNTLRTIYSMYRDSSRPINFRSRCVNHVIASIAPHCDVTAVVELYVGCISDVMEVVRSEVSRGVGDIIKVRGI